MTRIALFFFLLGCAPDRDPIRAELADDGLTAIELGNPAGPECGPGLSAHFRAMRGDERVFGIVCCDAGHCRIR